MQWGGGEVAACIHLHMMGEGGKIFAILVHIYQLNDPPY